MRRGKEVSGINNQISPIPIQNIPKSVPSAPSQIFETPEFSPLTEAQTSADSTETLLPQTTPVSQLNDLPTLRTQHPTLSTPHSALPQVSQLDDVLPSDWAFAALQALVERYGCVAGYPSGTFQGNRAISRYEFAASVNACLEQVNKLIANNTADITEEDLTQLQRLQSEFQIELENINKRIAVVEEQTDKLEKQFSTTTKLVGQAVFSIQGSNSGDVYFSKKGSDLELKNKAETNLTFASSAQLSLATSFTGKDLLLTGLSAGNLESLAGSVSSNMGRLGFESNSNQNLVVNDLSYRFPVSDNLGIIVGAAGVNPINTFRGINPLEGSSDGAISLFAQRNPILAVGNTTTGLGFDWQISDRLSLQGIYSTNFANFAGDSKIGGLFGGKYTTGGQLSLAPTNNIDIGIHYLYSHSPDDLLGTGIGDAQLVSIFAPDTDAFNTHAVGTTVTWRVNPNMQLGGWGGFTFSNPENLSGSVETSNWAVFAAFPNLFRQGNLGGILIGQPPKITSSTLPEGYNFPNFAEGGTSGGRSDSSLHLELFYRAQLSDNFAVTPGMFVVFNPNHNAASDPLIIAALRGTFRF
jgi:hypothetical protein